MGKLGDKLGELLLTFLTYGLNKAVDSVPDNLKDERITKLLDKTEKLGLDGASFAGGFAGAPMGFLPMLMDYWSEGRRHELVRDLRKHYEPFRLSPQEVITLIRRGFELEGSPFEWTQDLAEQGISKERIEALKKATELYPTPQDLITMIAHEVFEPDMIEKFKLDYGWDKVDKSFLPKIGMPEDIGLKYWISHWRHPDWGVLSDMLHRDKISEEDLQEWYKLVEMGQYWWDGLNELAWDLPNRIEIRMMARYLDLSHEEVVDLLKKAGLHENYRDDAASFMIIMGLQGYWATLYRNNWLTKEELEAAIKDKIPKPELQDKVFKYIVKSEQPQRIEQYAKLTQAAIIKGMKKGIISSQEAIQMLMYYRNYDEPEAEFIIATELASEGSPETPFEFRFLTEQYHKAVGKPYTLIPQEVIEAEKELYRIKAELKKAMDEEASQEVIDQLETSLAMAQAKFELLKEEHHLTPP